MSENKEDFALHCLVKNEEARKRLGIKAGFFWITAKKLSVAVSRCISAMDDKGYDEDDFKKPVRVNMPVENDLPPEGVFDTKFCANRKIGGTDGKTLVLIPGAASSVSTSDEKVEEIASTAETDDAATTNTVTDSDDTADDPLPAYAYNVNGEPMEEVLKEAEVNVATLPFIQRFLHIFYYGTGKGKDWKGLYWATADQRSSVARAEMNQDDKYIQNLLPVIRSMPELDKLDNYNMSKLTEAIQAAFHPSESAPQSYEFKNLVTAWRKAEPVRGLFAKEWAEDNQASSVDEPEMSDKPDLQKTRVTKADVATSGEPATKTTYKTIDTRIGCALTKGEITYPITARDVERGKTIVEADGEEFKRWSATYRITENIQFYDEKTHIEMIRQAPREVVTGSPELRRAYVDNYLAAYGTLDPDQMVYMPKRAPVDHKENMERVRKAGKNLRDIAAGRFNCDEEKPQSEDVLADEPAAPETVEPDTTERHQDTQSPDSTLPVESDKTPREQFSEQLAAERGDFVPGISDPNDPKWVRDNYSSSNDVEKTENHQPEADVVTVSSPEEELPPSQEWTEFFEPGRYEGVPNDVYHAANGISSTMV
ncbi:hypothetical protein FQW43_27845, partial [Salmonella enterica subsp. enterica serovar Enteritidis]|nr:hypothetical protein [Salmonella enterica subsp. enterica serovar Enteritidis]